MKRIAACLLVMLFVSGPVAAADLTPEHWQPVARLIGTSSGSSTGSAGEASVQRRYVFVMGGRYIQETNTSTYPPHELVDVFELAPPGQPWRIYSRTPLRRTSR